MVTFDGPLSASAYELLGVDATVSDDDLRRAYRLRLRQTHPDTGGDAAVFVRVQRAWELVGTPAARAAYDRGRARRPGRSAGRLPARPALAPAAARTAGRAPGGGAATGIFSPTSSVTR